MSFAPYANQRMLIVPERAVKQSNADGQFIGMRASQREHLHTTGHDHYFRDHDHHLYTRTGNQNPCGGWRTSAEAARLSAGGQQSSVVER